jgi:hypothetical protein
MVQIGDRIPCGPAFFTMRDKRRPCPRICTWPDHSVSTGKDMIMRIVADALISTCMLRLAHAIVENLYAEDNQPVEPLEINYLPICSSLANY